MKKFSIFIILTFIFPIMPSIQVLSSIQSPSETKQFSVVDDCQISFSSVNSESPPVSRTTAQTSIMKLSSNPGRTTPTFAEPGSDLKPHSAESSDQIASKADHIPGAAWILLVGLLGLVTFRKKIKST